VSDKADVNHIVSVNIATLAIAVMLMVVRLAMPYHELSSYLYMVSGYLIVLIVPSLIIEFLSKVFEEEIRQCGGLPHGGMLIGYAERSLIFLAFIMLRLEGQASVSEILDSISFIIAGKAIFRFSTRNPDKRVCADWYILGTFMSVLMGLLFSWIFLFGVIPCP